MNFSIKDFSSRCDQIRRKLRIWSHLLKKSLTENFIFAQCLLLRCYLICRCAFRKLSNIYSGIFCEDSQGIKSFKCFRVKNQSYMFCSAWNTSFFPFSFTVCFQAFHPSVITILQILICFFVPHWNITSPVFRNFISISATKKFLER